MDPIKTEKVSDEYMLEEPYQEIQSASDLSPGLRREIGEIQGRISDVHISDEDVYAELYDEAQRWSDLLPVLRRELTRIDGLLSRAQVLTHILMEAKLVLQQTISILSLSKVTIARLDRETCHTLLCSIKQFVPDLRRKFFEGFDGEQPWPNSRIDLQELSHSMNSSKVNDGFNYLVIELKYMRELYLPVLIDEHLRLKKLMSKDKDLADKLETLIFFVEKCMNLLALQREDVARVDKKEFRRLAQMTKLFIMGALMKKYGYDYLERVWPSEDLLAISELLQKVDRTLVFEAASGDYQCLPGSGALSEGDWHHQAYNELQMTRVLYSSLLDEACNNDYTGCLCDMLAIATRKFVEKSLAFLATSKAEMVSLSKEKCYYRMMLIKLFVCLTKGSVLANQNSLQPQAANSPLQTSETAASSNSASQNQLESLPNRRDWVYEELRSIRKNYSSELDEAYRIVRGDSIENSKPAKDPKLCTNMFLEESITFLGLGRADLALISEEECLYRLKRIAKHLNCPLKFNSVEEFLKSSSTDPTDSVQPETLPYWRDEVYDEIKWKKTKFFTEVFGPCKEVHRLTSQIPGAAQILDNIECCLRAVSRALTMNRLEIALCPKEEHELRVRFINGILAEVRDCLTSLQKMSGRQTPFPCNVGGVMLKDR